MYVPFPAVSACSKSQSNKHPTKRPIPARPTVSPPTPSHQRSVSLHGTPQRNSIRENFNSSNDPLHQIFPKTIPPKIFPGTFPKNLSGTHNNRTVRDFQKCRIASFARIPASNPHLTQPTQKNRNEKTALPFIPVCQEQYNQKIRVVCCCMLPGILQELMPEPWCSSASASSLSSRREHHRRSQRQRAAQHQNNCGQTGERCRAGD